MTIQYAFSTVACPDWTIDEVAAKAAEMGYQGVELRTLGGGGTKIASDPALSSADKVRAALEGAGIKPVCLSTSCALHYDDATQLFEAQRQINEYLEMAADMGCGQVRIFGMEVRPGENRRTVIERIGHNVLTLVEQAGELGVELLFENAGSFCSAKEWWWLLNLVEHPMLGLAWNIANSAAADANDHGGWVSVSTLNSRIRLAKVKDTVLGEGSGFTPLGEGDVGIENFLKRLRGVGYDGFLSVEWDRVWLPSLTPAEEYLPDALARLQEMQTRVDEWVAKGEALNEKTAAKNAPKSRTQLKEEDDKKRAKAAAAAQKAKEKAAQASA